MLCVSILLHLHSISLVSLLDITRHQWTNNDDDDNDEDDDGDDDNDDGKYSCISKLSLRQMETQVDVMFHLEKLPVFTVTPLLCAWKKILKPFYEWSQEIDKL